MIRLLILWMAFSPMAALANTNQEWQFRVFLDEREIGTHIFRTYETQGTRRVESDAQYAVTFLFINAYRYQHRAREYWRDNCLMTIETNTNDNGEQLKVSGVRNEAHFKVTSADGVARLPSCIMSFAYWNPAMLQQTQLLNAQTGELVEVRIEPLGKETLTVQGAPTLTRRYALHASNFRVDLWYLTNYQWVQLESRTENGKQLRYVLR